MGVMFVKFDKGGVLKAPSTKMVLVNTLGLFTVDKGDSVPVESRTDLADRTI